VAKPSLRVLRSCLTPGKVKTGCAISLVFALVGVVDSTGAQAATPSVYIWGHALNTGAEFSVPTALQGLPTGMVSVQAANWGGMAVDANGNVWDWGAKGELGNGTAKKNSWDTAVEAQGPTHVVSIGEGNSFAAAVDAQGDLWVWGNDKHGQLCLNRNGRNVTHPTEVPGVDARAVSGGGFHLEILLANGTVDTCGINQYGQLGNGTFKAVSKPTAVKGLTNVVAVSSGDLFSSALETDGSIWTWGYNRFGQLGIGSTARQDLPQEVTLPAPATEVYAGGDYPGDGHMLALLSNGVTEAWGNNAWGQLGQGTTTGMSSTPVPVQLSPGVTFTDVAAGGVTSYGIDTNGALWAWGGRRGELGNGFHSHVSQPQQVGKGFTAVSATATQSVGLSTGP
jgi:alpha-tubulin suppressor-like RCC1 family protein